MTPEPTRPGRWARSGSALEAAGVAAFTTWIAWPFVAPGGYVTDEETVRLSGPNLVATFQAWSEHRIPVWEPGIFGGTAFAGNLQAAAFSPLKLLVWPLGVPAAMGVLTAVHLFLLAFGMRHLARRTLGLAPPAGIVAAVVMVGSGTTMVRSVRFEQIAVVAWIPWLLVAADAVVAAPAGRRARPVAAAAAVTALVVLSGHPGHALIGGALAVAWAVMRIRDHSVSARPALARLAGSAGLGLGIAAVQIVLALPLLRHQAVPTDVLLAEAGRDRHTLWPARLLPGLLADLTGGPGEVQRPTSETPIFVGLAALVLAAAGVAACWSGTRGNRATVRGLVVAGAAATVVAFGPAYLVYRFGATVVPGFGNGGVPIRWMLVATVSISLLAAMGTTDLASRRAGPRGRRIAGALAAVAVIELALAARGSYARSLRTDVSFAGRVSTVDAYLASQGARALEIGRPGVNANLAAGWRSLDGYAGGLWLTQPYLTAAQRVSDGRFWSIERLGQQVHLPLDPDGLASLGVRFVVVDVSPAAPGTDAVKARRAQVVPGWSGPVVVDGTREVWENPRFHGEAVVLSGDRTVSGREAEPVRVPVTRPEPGVIEVSTITAGQGGGRLVVAEQALPGWRVTIDGRNADLVPVDGFSLGADVPPGSREVRFRYEPPGFVASVAVSLASLALTLVLAVAGPALGAGGSGRRRAARAARRERR